MSFCGSYIYSKQGKQEDIDRAVEIIKKYKLYKNNQVSDGPHYGIDEVIYDIKNDHRKGYPIIDWKKGQQIIFLYAPSSFHKSLRVAFNGYEYDIKEGSTELLSYEDYKFIMNNLEIVDIDSYILPLINHDYSRLTTDFKPLFNIGTAENFSDRKGLKVL